MRMAMIRPTAGETNCKGIISYKKKKSLAKF